MLTLDPRSCALVLIDLQQGILGFARAPHSADILLARAAPLVERFRALQAPVVRVKVGFSAGGADMLRPPCDASTPVPAELPPEWLLDPPSLPTQPGDLSILKRQWNAFFGTELDLQLRRRGIRSLVLGGIATPFGVESTARAAHELGYELVIAEDLCSAPSEMLHRHSIEHILPRLARVRSSSAILEALTP